jgi:hypothetical protein
VVEQAVGFGRDGLLDLRAQLQDPGKSAKLVHAHAEINDDEVGIRGEIDSLPLDAFRGHARLPHRLASNK